MVVTIFIPLTFVTGYYGMNFRNMAMIESHWGYWITVLVMVLIGLLSWIFHKKGVVSAHGIRSAENSKTTKSSISRQSVCKQPASNRQENA